MEFSAIPAKASTQQKGEHLLLQNVTVRFGLRVQVELRGVGFSFALRSWWVALKRSLTVPVRSEYTVVLLTILSGISKPYVKFTRKHLIKP